MSRRAHVFSLPESGGSIKLDAAQAHHLRDVLRLAAGDQIEVFDDAGRTARAIIERCEADDVQLRVQEVIQPNPSSVPVITIASAIPKGERADWMVEKLSELGIARFIPLVSERSVVVPGGKNKHDRWLRIAVESAKQSRRAGVMQVDVPTELKILLNGSPQAARRWFYLSTESATVSISSLVPHPSSLYLIGPEGGWSESEIDMFRSAGLTAIGLTKTILRVETAAVAAAAVIMTFLNTTGNAGTDLTSIS